VLNPKNKTTGTPRKELGKVMVWADWTNRTVLGRGRPPEKHPQKTKVNPESTAQDSRLKNHKHKNFMTGYKWVPTNEQMADPLTKTKLRKVLKSGCLKRPE